MVNKYHRQIAEQIKAFRKKKKLTQEQLTALFNSIPPLDVTVSKVTVSKYENCDCSMPSDKYLKFLDLFKTF